MSKMKTHEELAAVARELRAKYNVSVVVTMECQAQAYGHNGHEPHVPLQEPTEEYRVHLMDAINESFHRATLDGAVSAAHDFMHAPSLLETAEQLEAQAAKCRELAARPLVPLGFAAENPTTGETVIRN